MRNKLNYTVQVEIKNKTIRGNKLFFTGELPDSSKAIIEGLKPSLYVFVRERIIEPGVVENGDVNITVRFIDKPDGRSIEFKA